MDKTMMKRLIVPTKRHFNKKQKQSSSRFKTKKEKVRSLTAVAKELSTYQMGCNNNLSLSNKSNPSSLNNFNLPKKVFNEYSNNGVVHSSVPRKIRSAMKKRGRESMLIDSEKLNRKFYGIESPQKDSIKKSKKQVVLGPITKDEEEVAETLYALAGMFPAIGSNDKNELDCKSLPKKSSVLQEQEESTNATFQASEAIQDSNLIHESSVSPMEATKISSLSEINGVEQIGFTRSEDFVVARHNTARKVNLQGVPMTVKRSVNDFKVELHDPKLCLDMGLNVSTRSQFSQIGGKLDVEYETAGGIDCKEGHQLIMYQRENEGPTLWPGLKPTASAATNASYSQSSASAKAPHWLNAAISNSKHDLMESCSSGKISEAVHKKTWKSCAAHVHISQLIRSLEMPKRQVAKEPELYECHQISKCGIATEAQNLNGTRNRNCVAAGTVHPASLEIFPEIKNGILQQQCHYLDISLSQDPPTPAKYGLQKKSFNFLSLSTGGNELKVDNCSNKGGSRLEPFAKSQLPYFRSIQPQHGLMSIPTTAPSQYASTSYLHQVPAAGPQVRLQQQPHYYGTPLCGTHYSSTISYKQQYQNFWAAQLVAQGGSSGVNSNVVRAQCPNWQSGIHENSAVNQSAQGMLPHHSFVTRESLGSKATSISEQQPFSSILPSRTIGLEESRGRFHGSGTLSLQLLCDEHI